MLIVNEETKIERKFIDEMQDTTKKLYFLYEQAKKEQTERTLDAERQITEISSLIEKQENKDMIIKECVRAIAMLTDNKAYFVRNVENINKGALTDDGGSKES